MSEDVTLREFIERRIDHLAEKVDRLTDRQGEHQATTNARLRTIESFIERRSWRADFITRAGRALIALTALTGAVLGVVDALMH